MKKLILITFFVISSICIYSAVSKTVNVTTAGTLSTLLTATEKSEVTNLTVTGTIDARDFRFIRYNLTALSALDLKSASIVAFIGNGGSLPWSASYLANELPARAFSDYNNHYTVLKSIILPNNITKIDEDAFKLCSGLTSVTIPNSVTTLAEGVFSNCKELVSVTFGNSLANLPANNLFLFSCPKFAEFIVPVSNQSFSSIDGVLFNKQVSKIIYYPQAKVGHYTVPQSVYEIASRCFYLCNNLTTLFLDANQIQSIPTGIISACSELTDIYLGSSIKTIDSNFTSNCTKLVNFHVDSNNANFTSVDGVLFDKPVEKLVLFPKGKTGEYITPATTKSILSNSFYSVNGLASIVLSDSVTHIESMAFNDCIIQSIVLGKSVSNIGSYAFEMCKLNTLISLNTTPPTIARNSFGEIDDWMGMNMSETPKTYIFKAGYISAYSNATYWKNYISGKTILEYNVSTIGLTISNGGTISVNNNTYSNNSHFQTERIADFTLKIINPIGYEVDTLLLGNINVKNQLIDNSIVLQTSNYEDRIKVTFKKLKYKLTIKSAEEGEIDIFIEHGNKFIFIPRACGEWTLNCVLCNGNDITANCEEEIYTIPAITAPIVLNVIFAKVISRISPLINGVKVYPFNSEIVVEGCDIGETVRVYSASGKLLQVTESKGDKLFINAEEGVVYLVETKAKTFKIIL
jgi:hypothetical protein